MPLAASSKKQANGQRVFIAEIPLCGATGCGWIQRTRKTAGLKIPRKGYGSTQAEPSVRLQAHEVRPGNTDSRAAAQNLIGR